MENDDTKSSAPKFIFAELQNAQKISSVLAREANMTFTGS